MSIADSDKLYRIMFDIHSSPFSSLLLLLLPCFFCPIFRLFWPPEVELRVRATTVESFKDET